MSDEPVTDMDELAAEFATTLVDYYRLFGVTSVLGPLLESLGSAIDAAIDNPDSLFVRANAPAPSTPPRS